MRRTRDERGATAVEYAVIVALVSVVTIGGLTAVGGGAKAVVDRAAVALAGSAGEPEFSCVLPNIDDYLEMRSNLAEWSVQTPSVNYSFYRPAKDEPDLPEAVKTVTVTHPELMQQVLGCGGAPTMAYFHAYQINFHFRVFKPGYTYQLERPGGVHYVKYQLANPQLAGNQLTFTDSAPFPGYMVHLPWYDPTLEEEIQFEAARLKAEHSADHVEVTPIGKLFDEYGWDVMFESLDEDPPFPTLVSTFTIADSGVEVGINPSALHAEKINYE